GCQLTRTRSHPAWMRPLTQASKRNSSALATLGIFDLGPAVGHAHRLEPAQHVALPFIGDEVADLHSRSNEDRSVQLSHRRAGRRVRSLSRASLEWGYTLRCVSPARHAVAVASGKGGVGKSTVALNLALALRAEGGRVGILAAAFYGPAIP